MAIRFSRIIQAKQLLRRSSFGSNNNANAATTSADVPRGYCAVYVGESERKRHVIPIAYLNQPSFQNLLRQAEEEFGYDHPMGGLTIPCREDIFIDLTSRFCRV
ncbi:OLC1v1028026C1 [Oldenlandia corymbosa var. corymbosa]|uniref:OLC1v1028026C1 n=1 Tax=Oldenlandia corymbosa var. corymbosa TaxID=529605 RepID=A0AAV1CCK9_OLDCO|nr:OLC1v1028026C1 [Oldenlandia corymbosa var. corymbosa]